MAIYANQGTVRFRVYLFSRIEFNLHAQSEILLVRSSSCKFQCIWDFALTSQKLRSMTVYLDELDKFAKNTSSVNVFVNLY